SEIPPRRCGNPAAGPRTSGRRRARTVGWLRSSVPRGQTWWGLGGVQRKRQEGPLSRPCYNAHNFLRKLERAKRFELSTPTLARLCSTTELRPRSSRLSAAPKIREAAYGRRLPPLQW